ncbi:hypothetical protein HPB50_001759 [Hyalomma asiaticum]|uniref:Uncharacterized protein n=1 Tax=Hyalomma asiaticum TaxID=266040 RepID=A0ACB7T5I5_HYAAI|nr:hypothetical protein HPB50_001759 [Hyalomma asiaticum]
MGSMSFDTLTSGLEDLEWARAAEPEGPFAPYFLPLERRSHSFVDLCGATSQGVLCYPSVRQQQYRSRDDADSVSRKSVHVSRRRSTAGVFRRGLKALRRSFSAENGSKLGMAPLSRPQSHPGTPVGMPTTPLPPGLPPAGGGGSRGVCYIGTAGSLDDTGVTSVTGSGNPGRDSPSGGSVESRHSSSSLDSGRGSSSSSSADSKVAHRLSTGSHGSSSSLTLTSSVGSHMSSLTPEVVVLSPLNVAGLLVNGVSVSAHPLSLPGAGAELTLCELRPFGGDFLPVSR